MQRIGRFEVIAELPEDRQGRWYHGRDRSAELDAAICDLGGIQALDPALSERVRQVRKIQDGALARVYDLIEQDGAWYLATELVEGAVPDDQRGSPADRVRMVVAAARALARVHARGLAHGQLDRSSLRVIADGSVKIAGLGLPGSSGLAREHGSGTARAPELRAGGEPDPRSDVFSLGVVAYELMCGRTPFVAADQTSMAAMQELGTTSYAWLEGVVRRCLDSDPELRYQTAGELAIALDAGLAQEEEAAARAGADWPQEDPSGTPIGSPGGRWPAALAPAPAERPMPQVTRGWLGLALALAMLVVGSLAYRWRSGAEATAGRGSPAEAGRATALERSADSGKPATGTPASGTPATEKPAPETPASGTPASGTPASGTPASGTPANGTPASGTPASGTPASGTPASVTPASGTPASESGTVSIDPTPTARTAEAAATPSEQVKQLLEEAAELARRNDWTRPPGRCALDKYRAVLRLDPENDAARTGIASVIDFFVRRGGELAREQDVAGARIRYQTALEVLRSGGRDARLGDLEARRQAIEAAVAALGSPGR